MRQIALALLAATILQAAPAQAGEQVKIIKYSLACDDLKVAKIKAEADDEAKRTGNPHNPLSVAFDEYLQGTDQQVHETGITRCINFDPGFKGERILNSTLSGYSCVKIEDGQGFRALCYWAKNDTIEPR